MGVLAVCAAGSAVLVEAAKVSATTAAAFLGGFAFSMIFLTPDLDLVRSRPTRRWGRLSFLWWPYARLFRHRGVSHHLFWGPLTRIAYLLLIGLGAAAALGAALHRPLQLGVPNSNVWALLAGVFLPNVIHTLVDGVRARRHGRRGGD